MDKQYIYSPTQAVWGTFLGGPLASVIFLRKNFQVLKNPVAEKKTVLLGTILLLVIIGILPFLPDKFPNMVIPFATTVSTRMIIEKYQFTRQTIVDSDCLTFQSNWCVFFVSIACLVVFFIVAMAFMLSLEYFGITEMP
ncbi:MAG: hypothetical protein AB7D06_04030 [Pedobacter sp.]